jgi:hypothetical protein
VAHFARVESDPHATTSSRSEPQPQPIQLPFPGFRSVLPAHRLPCLPVNPRSGNQHDVLRDGLSQCLVEGRQQ